MTRGPTTFVVGPRSFHPSDQGWPGPITGGSSRSNNYEKPRKLREAVRLGGGIAARSRKPSTLLLHPSGVDAVASYRIRLKLKTCLTQRSQGSQRTTVF